MTSLAVRHPHLDATFSAFDLRSYATDLHNIFHTNEDGPIALILSSQTVFDFNTSVGSLFFTQLALQIAKVKKININFFIMTPETICETLERLRGRVVEFLIISSIGEPGEILIGHETISSIAFVALFDSRITLHPKAQIALDVCHGSEDGITPSLAQAFRSTFPTASIVAYHDKHSGIYASKQSPSTLFLFFFTPKTPKNIIKEPDHRYLLSKEFTGTNFMHTQSGSEVLPPFEEGGTAARLERHQLNYPTHNSKFNQHLQQTSELIFNYPNEYFELLTFIIRSGDIDHIKILDVIIIGHILKVVLPETFKDRADETLTLWATQLHYWDLEGHYLAKICLYAFGLIDSLADDNKYTNYSKAILDYLNHKMDLPTLITLFISYRKSEKPEWNEFFKEIAPILNILKTGTPRDLS